MNIYYLQKFKIEEEEACKYHIYLLNTFVCAYLLYDKCSFILK